ncbi:hypothetical protein PALB_6960 [Pseudoalteromonas luteoviolacea B = ATCC 29581]|nr:hypothetical protein PALB_6960 [Pseudoalteromonas luteoviolacea B = ATCC 29581]
MNSSSKRGRPARQMSEDKIIQIVMDFYRNPDYFRKLFGLLDTYQEEEFFTSFLADMHKKLSGKTASKTDFLKSTTDLDQKMESIKGSSKTDSETQEMIEDFKGDIPVITDEDIEEFQSVISKLPDRLWKRYNNRLRQQSYKKHNRWSRQIEFNEDAYFELRSLKDSLNVKTWNDLPFQLESDYKLIRSICDSLQVSNINAASVKINEMLHLRSNKK